ncbi:MAG: hypothetical protein HZA21_01950, partial [Nitrospirae bacterium]|nr:hypothetical protein [Nitrospirota bacterium]
MNQSSISSCYGGLRALVGAVAALLLLACLVPTSRAEPCRVALEQNDVKFPVEQLDPAALCLIEPVVNRAT